MNASSACVSVCVAVGLLAGTANALNMETVPVGNPRNAGEWSGESYGGSGPDRICGAVDYAYNIGKYEVTAGQYCEFLNKVAATDTYGLYNPNMSQTNYGSGISRSGSSGSYTYSVAPAFVNRPVNYVSYWDACRFANWLHNGQPTGTQDASTTERGAYTLDGYNGHDGRTIQRNSNWKWAITSEDEWYKAAYHKNDGVTGNYWDYPTSSDTDPGRDLTDASGNNANYKGTPYPIDSPYYTTVAGEFQNSASPYGTFDQGGNVWEWNEAVVLTSTRGMRGASWDDSVVALDASWRSDYDPTFETGNGLGFRVSANATTVFADGFEDAALNPFWTVTAQENYDISLVASPVHSGDQALALTALNNDSQPGTANLEHFWDVPQRGTISIWFYDHLPSVYDVYAGFTVWNTSLPGNEYGGVSVRNDVNYYHDNVGPTSVARSLGWHEIKIVVDSSGASTYVDGTLASTNTLLTEFDNVQIWSASSAGRTATYQFDDFQLTADPTNVLELNVDPVSLYVKPTDSVVIDLDVSALAQKVSGCQAVLNFSSTYFATGSGDVDVAPGGSIWNDVIYNVWDVAGDLDMVVGVDIETPGGTDADDTIAVITLTPTGTEGTTQMVFRDDVDELESTFFGDMSAQAVYPGAKLDSQTIVIDGTDPVVAVVSPNGGEQWAGGSSQTISWTATDTNIDANSIAIEYYDGSVWQALASGEVNDGSYTWDPVPSLDITNARVRVTVSDLAGNSGSDESDGDFVIDSLDPTVDDIAATQGGADLTPSGIAVQGAVSIAVAVSDSASGVAGAPTVTVTPNGGSAESAAYVGESPAGTYNYTWTVVSTTPNGQATITVTGLTDNVGHVASDATDTLTVDKNQISGEVELEGLLAASRDVTFVATGGVRKEWTLTLSFTAGVADYVLTEVPDGTTLLSAKAAWNLRERVDSPLDGDKQAVAVNFTRDGVGDWADATDHYLRAGDLNGSNTINVLDYGVLKINWFTEHQVADINGDGQVQMLDYSLLKTNMFQQGDDE